MESRPGTAAADVGVRRRPRRALAATRPPHRPRQLPPHFGNDGKVIGFYVMAYDITERRKAEEAIHELKFQPIFAILRSCSEPLIRIVLPLVEMMPSSLNSLNNLTTFSLAVPTRLARSVRLILMSTTFHVGSDLYFSFLILSRPFQRFFIGVTYWL